MSFKQSIIFAATAPCAPLPSIADPTNRARLTSPAQRGSRVSPATSRFRLPIWLTASLLFAFSHVANAATAKNVDYSVLASDQWAGDVGDSAMGGGARAPAGSDPANAIERPSLVVPRGSLSAGLVLGEGKAKENPSSLERTLKKQPAPAMLPQPAPTAAHVAVPAPAPASPTAATLAAIDATCHDYIDGQLEGNAVRVARSLHPELVNRWVRTKMPHKPLELESESIDVLLESTRKGVLKTPVEKWDRTCTVLGVAGDAASIRLDTPWWVAFFHLGNFDGKWLIVDGF